MSGDFTEIRADIGNQRMLRFMATALKTIELDHVGQEVNLYTHRDEISICVRLSPEKGGYQGVVDAKEEKPHHWTISVHRDYAQLLKHALVALYT